MLREFRMLVWSETFWLPKQKLNNVTWDDLRNKENGTYFPQVEDLHWAFFLGIAFLGVRYVYETLLVIPIGRRLGLKEKTAAPPENKVLENYFVKYGIPENNNYESVSKQTDLSVREVERWFRQRRRLNTISAMQKFTECSWHFIFYLSSFLYGLIVLWNKSWFKTTTYCWKDWPRQEVTSDIYWYYLLELGFYWSLIFTLMSDHKRKDFNVMIVHHAVTLTLMYFSWALNFVRIGTLVLVTHDAADYWLAIAKMAKYAKQKSVCEALFAIFILVWILSRLIYYPVKVLNSTTFELYDALGHFMSYYLFNILLYALQLMHIVWTYMILKVVAQKLKHGELKHDVRSDSENDSDDDSD